MPFRHRCQKINGAEFYGQVGGAEEDISIAHFVLPRRTLRCTRRAGVVPGDVFQYNGRYFLVLDQEDSSDGEIVQFKILTCNVELTWKRFTTSVDSTTGLGKSSSTQTLGTIHCVMEPLDIVHFGSTQETRNYRFLCGAAIQPTDLVGSHKVEKVENVLGVKFALVR